jgi:hypothetical protein
LSVVSDPTILLLLILQRLKQSWKQYITGLPKRLCKIKRQSAGRAAFYFTNKVLLLMKVLNLTKLLMIMWDKVQETVQFIKAKMILT